MLTNCGKQTSVKLKLRKLWLNIELMFAGYRRSYNRDLVLARYKNQRVIAKAVLPIYPSQTKPKQKSRKSRQLEVAANKPGQKKIKSFFPSSVKTEPGNENSPFVSKTHH